MLKAGSGVKEMREVPETERAKAKEYRIAFQLEWTHDEEEEE